MPTAGGLIAALAHHWEEDHDSYEVDETPPVQNTWYEVCDEDDVRVIWCSVYQTNTEAAAKNVEYKWTIDGTVYFGSISLPDADTHYVYRNELPGAGGTAGLFIFTDRVNAAWYVDKRGHSFKAEVRITDAPGTAQQLRSRVVLEHDVAT